MQKKTRNAGVSLVELMTVVAIIGVLTAIAVPRLQTYRMRAIQTEGKAGLNGVFLAMQAYVANYSRLPTYPSGLATAAGIGFAVSGGQQNYRYYLVSPGAPAAWAASANTLERLANGRFDNLRMSSNRWICHAFDAVSNRAAVPSTLVVPGGPGNGTLCPESASGGSSSWLPGLVNPSDFIF